MTKNRTFNRLFSLPQISVKVDYYAPWLFGECYPKLNPGLVISGYLANGDRMVALGTSRGTVTLQEHTSTSLEISGFAKNNRIVNKRNLTEETLAHFLNENCFKFT